MTVNVLQFTLWLSLGIRYIPYNTLVLMSDSARRLALTKDTTGLCHGGLFQHLDLPRANIPMCPSSVLLTRLKFTLTLNLLLILICSFSVPFCVHIYNTFSFSKTIYSSESMFLKIIISLYIRGRKFVIFYDCNICCKNLIMYCISVDNYIWLNVVF